MISIYIRLGSRKSDSLFFVRPARTYSKGCKSLNRPDSGKVTAKGEFVRRETESEGSRRQTSRHYHSYQADATGVNDTTFDDLDRYAIDDYLQKVM